MAIQEAAQKDSDEEALLAATMDDQACVQRATTCSLMPLRVLGRGAFATIDLVSFPAASGTRKLLVRKRLAHEQGCDSGSSTSGLTHKQQQQQQHSAAASPLPQLKLSTELDWRREADMHRQCAGCPFVLQLLAAKRCRAGSLLLLTEFAAAGSLTDVLTRLQGGGTQHQQPQLQQQQPDLVLVQSASTAEAVSGVLDTCCSAATAGAVLVHGVDVVVDPAMLNKGPAAPALGGNDAPTPAAAPAAGLSEEAARFYAACILMGLSWLHSRRIVHRDVKPCNLLLFSDGYVKIADLGCCVMLPHGVTAAHTRTGTAPYMAPEVTAADGSGYSYPVDLWSLGVTLWQMVAGSLPSWAEAQQQHQQHQQEQSPQAGGTQQQPDVLLPLQPADTPHTTPQDLAFPAHFSRELCELLDGLLHQDSAARLSIPQVQASSWFQKAGFDWSALQDKTLPPPTLPPPPATAAAPSRS